MCLFCGLVTLLMVGCVYPPQGMHSKLWQRQRRARTHHAPSSYWLHRIHAQGQRTLTEVDGVVEIGPDTLRPYTAASSRGWPMGRACLTLLEFHLDDSELLRRVESGVGLTHETCHARYWTHEACPTPALLRAPLDRMTRLAARCHRSVQRAAGEKPLDSRLRAGSRTACSVCVLRHNAARSRLPGRKCVHGDRPWHSISTTVTRGVCI